MRSLSVAIFILGCLHFVFGQPLPTFTPPIPVGRIDDPELDETSGIAASRKFPGVIYAHNDHGNRPRIFAINATDAHVIATIEISPAKNTDWEDMAVGPCGINKNDSCIFILDDGKSGGAGARTVYRIPEPDAILDQTLAPESTLRYNWSEPAANTVMVDAYGFVYIIANVDGGRGMIVNLPASAWGQTDRIYVESGAFYAMYSSHSDPEGGDISPDGSEILIQDSTHVYYYRPAENDIFSALTHPGVDVPFYHVRYSEALCWSADGSSYFTLGEGHAATLYRYDRQ